MFRVMLILVVLVLVPAALVFWRTRDRTTPVTPPPAPSSKLVGTSTLSHGGSPQPATSTAPAVSGAPQPEGPGRNP